MQLLESQHKPQCQDCKLCEDRINIVGSHLPADAEILFITDCPDETEDRSGIPFSGRGGKALNDVLAQVELSLTHPKVAYAYSARCFPKDKKEPNLRKMRPVKDKEVLTCFKYLEEEIKTLKNLKIIVGMGAPTARALIKDSKLKLESVFGKLLFTDYGKVLITHNPRRLLYSPDPRELLKIKTEIIQVCRSATEVAFGENKKEKKKRNYYVALNMKQVDWVIDRLKQAKEFSYDLETSSLDYLSSRILSISFSWKAETAATIPFFRQHLEPIWTEDENKAIYAKLKSIMEDSQYRKIAQNGKFDNSIFLVIK
jgi:uracil-DNA glycosylase family 4